MKTYEIRAINANGVVCITTSYTCDTYAQAMEYANEWWRDAGKEFPGGHVEVKDLYNQ